MKWLSIFAMLVFCIFVAIVLGPIALHGWPAVKWNYLTSEPLVMGREGGVAPLIVTTVWMNGLALILTFFLGLPVSLRLAELSASRFQKVMAVSLDLLASTPSIVFGLFGHAFFCRALGMGYSILAGSLTLTFMTLPLFIRLVEDSLRELPSNYRLIAKSLRLSPTTLAFQILIPSVWPAITAAIVLSWTRALGETAALLFTSGYSMRWPQSMFDSGRTLSVHIFDLSLNITGADQMAYQAAFVLILITVAFILICRLFVKGLITWQLRHQST
ncbi:MAG: ABC transporter permease subunit [Bdellovibrionales bacterium]|nr:ABC transporter permease subunit [Bdellovibrionales bacterium]